MDCRRRAQVEVVASGEGSGKSPSRADKPNLAAGKPARPAALGTGVVAADEVGIQRFQGRLTDARGAEDLREVVVVGQPGYGRHEELECYQPEEEAKA